LHAALEPFFVGMEGRQLPLVLGVNIALVLRSLDRILSLFEERFKREQIRREREHQYGL